jgi:hypothetical protein
MRLISISNTIAVPPNGLVLFVGTILTDEGKEKKVSFDFEPHKPINTWVIVKWVGEDDEGNHLERVLSILSLLLMDYMGRGRTTEIPQFVLNVDLRMGRADESQYLSFRDLRIQIVVPVWREFADHLCVWWWWSF